jgi:ribosome biogenesis protein YTM1
MTTTTTKADDVQITATFVTSIPNPKYVVPPSPITVPGKLTRYGLSEVINHLLDLERTIPFDFFIDGHLLRTSLAKMAQKLNKSAEQTLVVEYVPAQMPPEEAKAEEKRDWISSVSGSWRTAMVAGCYDGSVYVYDSRGEEIESLVGHEGYVTCVTLAPPPPSSSSGCLVVAGGTDCTARVFRLDENGKRKGERTHKVFRGHDMQINCVASTTTRASSPEDVGNSVRLFCTGSDDTTVKLWNLDGGMDSEEDATKRDKEKEGKDGNKNKRKLDDEKTQNNESGSAMLTLEGHTERVTGCAFENPRSLWTCSWDRSIRNWDVETGEMRESFVGTDESARTCLAVRKRVDDLDMTGTETTCVVAHGGTDSIVRIWDPREGNASGGTMLLRGHQVRFFFLLYDDFSSFASTTTRVLPRLSFDTNRAGDDQIIYLHSLSYS